MSVIHIITLQSLNHSPNLPPTPQLNDRAIVHYSIDGITVNTRYFAATGVDDTGRVVWDEYNAPVDIPTINPKDNTSKSKSKLQSFLNTLFSFPNDIQDTLLDEFSHILDKTDY